MKSNSNNDRVSDLLPPLELNPPLEAKTKLLVVRIIFAVASIIFLYPFVLHLFVEDVGQFGNEKYLFVGSFATAFVSAFLFYKLSLVTISKLFFALSIVALFYFPHYGMSILVALLGMVFGYILREPWSSASRRGVYSSKMSIWFSEDFKTGTIAWEPRFFSVLEKRITFYTVTLHYLVENIEKTKSIYGTGHGRTQSGESVSVSVPTGQTYQVIAGHDVTIGFKDPKSAKQILDQKDVRVKKRFMSHRPEDPAPGQNFVSQLHKLMTEVGNWRDQRFKEIDAKEDLLKETAFEHSVKELVEKSGIYPGLRNIKDKSSSWSCVYWGGKDKWNICDMIFINHQTNRVFIYATPIGLNWVGPLSAVKAAVSPTSPDQIVVDIDDKEYLEKNKKKLWRDFKMNDWKEARDWIERLNYSHSAAETGTQAPAR